MKPTKVKVEGREYVMLPVDEYERLSGLARVAEGPSLPETDARGNFPAVEYARASIARDIVRQRIGLGLSQRELAHLAKVRVETLCRIETGRHTASTATLVKVDRALKQAATRKSARKGA